MANSELQHFSWYNWFLVNNFLRELQLEDVSQPYPAACAEQLLVTQLWGNSEAQFRAWDDHFVCAWRTTSGCGFFKRTCNGMEGMHPWTTSFGLVHSHGVPPQVIRCFPINGYELGSLVGTTMYFMGFMGYRGCTMHPTIPCKRPRVLGAPAQEADRSREAQTFPVGRTRRSSSNCFVVHDVIWIHKFIWIAISWWYSCLYL